MDKVGVLDPPRCSMVFSWLCRLKKPKAFRCKDQKIFDPTLPINSFWKNIVGIMKAIKCISWIFPQNKKTLQHGMLRISLSVSLYLKYMVIPFPLRIFLPNSEQKSLPHWGTPQSNTSQKQGSVSWPISYWESPPWLVEEDAADGDDDGTPISCLAKDKFVPPPKKKHTHVFGCLLGWKTNCVYAQSCTPTWRTKEVSWGVLMFFFDALTHETIGFHAFGDLVGTHLNKRTNKCIYRKASWTGKCPWVYQTTYLQNDPNPAMSRTNHILKQISTRLAPPRHKWINPYKYRVATGVTHLYISR